ncbi:MAG: N(4)-(beta-N-acetylglucosaminyl)-L-asparaginase [bacterium]|jgi:N4-(beta-N-acetylglucosaminyl)-L-asparaginase|nr:N(4)-(beta-N-acetylglucosaminyl)-L-asparaginase [bacterium]
MTEDATINRRHFARQSVGYTAAAVAAGSGLPVWGAPQSQEQGRQTMKNSPPILISTWDFGLEANAAGLEVLRQGGRALDAVETAARVTELNPRIDSVGYGGLPNEHGVLQLDAALIDGKTGKMGSVAALEGFRGAIAVARRVLEISPHIMLAGEGAREFAIKQGFPLEPNLTPASAAWYAEQLKQKETQPSGHDTIGVLALDAQREMAVACTTSGLAMKWNGRVGDSPLIGAGLYLDGQVGGAVGTGTGERAIEVCGAFAIVEFMREGLSPQQACEKLIRRMVERNRPRLDFQFAYIALSAQGEIGAACIQEGFKYAECIGETNELKTAKVYGKDFE